MEAAIPIMGDLTVARLKNITAIEAYERIVKESFLSCIISCVRFVNRDLFSNVLSLF